MAKRPRRGQEAAPRSGMSEGALARRLKQAERTIRKAGTGKGHVQGRKNRDDGDPDPVDPDYVEPGTEEADDIPPSEASLDETDYVMDVPDLHPDDVAAAMAQSVSLREVTDEDLDRLWDWLRADEDRGQRFLGALVNTSSEMRARLDLFQQLQAIDDAEEHVGFLGFSPVDDYKAGCHLFLAQAARNQLAQLIPQFMKQAAVLLPGRTFLVNTADAAVARIYRPYGFTMRYILTWTPPKAAAPDA